MRCLILSAVVAVTVLTVGCYSVPPRAADQLMAISAESPPKLARVGKFGSPGTADNLLSKPKIQRQMIYNAELTVTVPSITSAMIDAKNLTENLGGYLQKQSNRRRSMTVKVPSKKLEKFINEISKLGNVTSKDISCRDVTDQMFDLDIRIDNLEKLRTRLTELLKKAKKVEDMIKIENELGRITGELERLKGQIRLMKNKVAYATIEIKFNSPVPHVRLVARVPVPWVRSLGNEIQKNNYYPNGRDDFPYDMELPVGFVALFARYDSLVAVSAGDVFLKLTVHDNLKGGNPEFWRKLIERSLTEGHFFRIVSRKEIKLDDGTELRVINAAKTIGGKRYQYMIAFAVVDHWYWSNPRVILFEAWGPENEFEKVEKGIEKSLKTMDL